MKFLGFQIPNYTFPGVTNDRLFDHVAMLANTAERAGVDLERHCEAVGRDPRTIVKTRLGSLIIGKTDAEAERLYEQLLNRPGVNRDWARAGFIVGGPDRVAEQARTFLDAGLDGLIFNMPHMEDPEAIALAGETLARLRQPAAAR